MLIGVSFLAAPAQFAPAEPVAADRADGGPREFGTLDLVEAGFAVVNLALACLIRASRLVWVGLGVAAAIVLLQGEGCCPFSTPVPS